MTTVKTHPLAEIIAKKLFSIESVPPEEARRMVGRSIKAAIAYHESEMSRVHTDYITKQIHHII